MTLDDQENTKFSSEGMLEKNKSKVEGSLSLSPFDSHFGLEARRLSRELL